MPASPPSVAYGQDHYQHNNHEHEHDHHQSSSYFSASNADENDCSVAAETTMASGYIDDTTTTTTTTAGDTTTTTGVYDETTTTALYDDYTIDDGGDETTYIASNQLTPDEHVAQGIAFHESGNDASLSRSTYHLRLAARAGHPTGMLLYALACRHGWGVRPNAGEGVRWLKKALDLGREQGREQEHQGAGSVKRQQSTKGGDILTTITALDPNSNPNRNLAPPSPAPSSASASTSTSATNANPYRPAPTHRAAHLALAVYELGVSHMNGWGTPIDRRLALRCFDIAAAWGDLDALTEAAFCYAEGIGCARDRPRAARMYRAAERRGKTLVGNSWIYKDKYMDEQDGGGGKDNKKKDNAMNRFFAGFSKKKKAKG